MPKQNVSASLSELKRKMEQQREEAQKVLEQEFDDKTNGHTIITENNESIIDNSQINLLNENGAIDTNQNKNNMMIQRPIITSRKDPKWNEYIGKTHYFRQDQIVQIENLVALTGRGKNEIMRLAWDYFYSNIVVDD